MNDIPGFPKNPKSAGAGVRAGLAAGVTLLLAGAGLFVFCLHQNQAVAEDVQAAVSAKIHGSILMSTMDENMTMLGWSIYMAGIGLAVLLMSLSVCLAEKRRGI